MKVFQKALQYNDPKKVHLALLGVFERSEQHKLADELADNMIKRFRKSCKVHIMMPYICFSPIRCLIIINTIFHGILGLAKAGAEALDATAGWGSGFCLSC